MEPGFFNITSAVTTTLQTILTGSGAVISIRLTNVHATLSVGVEIFIEDFSGNKSHILHSDIPGSVTLLLDESFKYDSSKFSLKITTSGSGLAELTPLSIIIT